MLVYVLSSCCRFDECGVRVDVRCYKYRYLRFGVRAGLTLGVCDIILYYYILLLLLLLYIIYYIIHYLILYSPFPSVLLLFLSSPSQCSLPSSTFSSNNPSLLPSNILFSSSDLSSVPPPLPILISFKVYVSAFGYPYLYSIILNLSNISCKNI